MSATQKQRDVFIGRMVHEYAGTLSVEEVVAAVRRILRLGVRYRRLQEAYCNDDWPAGHGQRNVAVCPRCESTWDPATVRKDGCLNCRTEAAVVATAQRLGCGVVFQGDPRGATIKLVLPSGYTDDWAREGLCVPTS